MARVLASRWWALTLRGVFAIAFGVLTLAVPGLSLAALVLLFGAYAIVDGVFNLVAALRGATGRRPWWSLLLEGIASLAAGVESWWLCGSETGRARTLRSGLPGEASGAAGSRR